MWRYFKSSFVITFLAFAGLGVFFGVTTGRWDVTIEGIFIAFVLAILEVSLSFDNAIVNATILKDMTPLWRRRFLTWGILIAVFGMRLVFPVAIVSVVGSVSPVEALVLALRYPDKYAQLMLSTHTQVAAFGGAFLMMVCLKYFYDVEKTSHWLSAIEKPLVKLGKIASIEIGLTLLSLVILSYYVEPAVQLSFLLAGFFGLLTYIAVDGLSSVLESRGSGLQDAHRASFGMFLYLEVLDASFSFDGVVGAFAITHHLVTIMVGLGVGAFFVRSLTIYFVEQETLSQFEFLEHGAFYAIGILAAIMLLDPFLHIPEWVTGLAGAVVIGLSLHSSLRAAKTQKKSGVSH